MRVVIYTRISDPRRQRDGASLETQLKDCRKYAQKQEGWVILYELEDRQTGLDSERIEYQRLLELIKAKQVDVVLVHKYDRFGRDELEAALRYRDLTRAKVKLISATEGQREPFMMKLGFLLANEESQRTSQRVHPNMITRVEQGLWVSRVPVGYYMDPLHKGRLIKHPDKSFAIVRLFEEGARTPSLNALTRWVNAQTEFPKEWLISPKSKATQVRHDKVRDILMNPVYKGWVRWNTHTQSRLHTEGKREQKPREEWVMVRGVHEPLVSEELWEQVQLNMTSRTEMAWGTPLEPKGKYLLTGLVKCYKCDFNWSGFMILKGKRHYQHTRYKCPFNHGSVHGDRTEDYVWRFLETVQFDEEFYEYIMGEFHKGTIELMGDTLQQERNALERRLDAATELLLDGTLSKERYLVQKEKIEAEINAIDVQRGPEISTHHSLKYDLEMLKMALGVSVAEVRSLDKAELPVQQSFLRLYISHIVLEPRKDPVVVLHPWVQRFSVLWEEHQNQLGNSRYGLPYRELPNQSKIIDFKRSPSNYWTISPVFPDQGIESLR